MDRASNELHQGDGAPASDQARPLPADGAAGELMDRELSVSHTLVKARTTAKALLDFPGSPPDSLTEAYRIQDHSIRRWDDSISGWKVGGIPEVLRPTLGADWLVGPIFDRAVKHANADRAVEMPVYEGGFAAIEPELIIQLGTDRSTDKMFIGAEIASSPVPAINDHGPTAVICDFGNNNGLLIGAEIADWQEYGGDTEVKIWIDNEFIGAHTIANLAQSAMPALEFYLSHMASHSREPAPGTYVSTGAITGIHEALVGAKSTISFDQWGELRLELTSALPASNSPKTGGKIK